MCAYNASRNIFIEIRESEEFACRSETSLRDDFVKCLSHSKCPYIGSRRRDSAIQK